MSKMAFMRSPRGNRNLTGTVALDNSGPAIVDQRVTISASAKPFERIALEINGVAVRESFKVRQVRRSRFCFTAGPSGVLSVFWAKSLSLPSTIIASGSVREPQLQFRLFKRL